MIKLTRNGISLYYPVEEAINLMSQMPLQDAIAAVLDNAPSDVAELMISYPKDSPYFQFLVYLISDGWKHETDSELREQLSAMLEHFPFLAENICEIIYNDSDVFYQFFKDANIDKASWQRIVTDPHFQEKVQDQMQEMADLKLFGPNTSQDLMALIIEHKIINPNMRDQHDLSPLYYAETEDEIRFLIGAGADASRDPEYLIFYYDLGKLDVVKKYIHDRLSPLSSDVSLPTEIIKLLKQIIQSENSAKKQEMLKYFVEQDPLFKKWINILQQNSNLSEADLLKGVLNYQHSSRESALMVAYQRRGGAYVRLFIELGADINQKGKNGIPFIIEILKASAGSPSKAMIKNKLLSYLFTLDPVINREEATDLLGSIAPRGHGMTGATFQYLLKNGADIEAAINNPLALGYVLDCLPDDEWALVLDKCNLTEILLNANNLYIALNRVGGESAPHLFAMITERLGESVVKEMIDKANPTVLRFLAEILPDSLKSKQETNNNNYPKA